MVGGAPLGFLLCTGLRGPAGAHRVGRGQHGLETDRPRSRAQRGPPAQPEAPREPAALGQEHGCPPSEDPCPGGLGDHLSRNTGGSACSAQARETQSPEAAQSPEAGGVRSRGWAVPSVLGQRQGQGSLEGGFLVDAVILEGREGRRGMRGRLSEPEPPPKDRTVLSRQGHGVVGQAAHARDPQLAPPRGHRPADSRLDLGGGGSFASGHTTRSLRRTEEQLGGAKVWGAAGLQGGGAGGHGFWATGLGAGPRRGRRQGRGLGRQGWGGAGHAPRRCRRRTCACAAGAAGSWRSCSWGPPRASPSRWGTPATRGAG